MLEMVEFGVASFAQHVFAACLSPGFRLRLRGVGYMEQNSLDCSSAVVELVENGVAISRAVARAVLRQHADADVAAGRTAGGSSPLSLCLHRAAFLSEDDRRDVRIIDLSRVASLPRAFNLRDCEWMREARLPLWLTAVPESFFKGCRRLTRVNLEECARLRSVGEGAFEGCLSLGQVSLPRGVLTLDWGWSGLVQLDLRGLRLRKLRLQPCNLLEQLIMPVVGGADVVLGPCPWLRELSIGYFDRGDRRRCCAVRPERIRFTSTNGQFSPGLMTAASNAAVFAETAGLGRRLARVALPG